MIRINRRGKTLRPLQAGQPAARTFAKAPTPDCLPLHRLCSGILHLDWTPEERRHLRACAYCRKLYRTFRRRMWHPSPRQLRRYWQGELTGWAAEDIRYHLEVSRCRRCRSRLGLEGE